MVTQLGWFALGFLGGLYTEAKLKAYLEKNYPVEWAKFKAVQAELKQKKEDLARKVGEEVTAYKDLDKMLKASRERAGIPNPDNVLAEIFSGIKDAFSTIDWEKEASKFKHASDHLFKDLKGGDFKEKDCCGKPGDDCCL